MFAQINKLLNIFCFLWVVCCTDWNLNPKWKLNLGNVNVEQGHQYSGTGDEVGKRDIEKRFMPGFGNKTSVGGEQDLYMAMIKCLHEFQKLSAKAGVVPDSSGNQCECMKKETTLKDIENFDKCCEQMVKNGTQTQPTQPAGRQRQKRSGQEPVLAHSNYKGGPSKLNKFWTRTMDQKFATVPGVLGQTTLNRVPRAVPTPNLTAVTKPIGIIPGSVAPAIPTKIPAIPGGGNGLPTKIPNIPGLPGGGNGSNAGIPGSSIPGVPTKIPNIPGLPGGGSGNLGGGNNSNATGLKALSFEERQALKNRAENFSECLGIADMKIGQPGYRFSDPIKGHAYIMYDYRVVMSILATVLTVVNILIE
ncbi:uncharacterized protein LOC142344219 [Convolutriloba macropyga]|uniref:uncharacterized protein LOC142344219 n=1 Tax=Convolutriloba macropyga TaxID=536237 RepID=UPI003F5262E9